MAAPQYQTELQVRLKKLKIPELLLKQEMFSDKRLFYFLIISSYIFKKAVQSS